MLTPPNDAVLDAREPGWEPVPRNLRPGASLRSWLDGDPHDTRCRVRFFFRDERMFCRVWFGPGTEGPPGHVHGGCIATVLDNVMGGCCWLNGYKVLAANLSVDFRASVPLGTIAIADAAVEAVDGRKVTARGWLRGADGRLFAEGRGLFVVIPEERLAALNQRRDELEGG